MILKPRTTLLFLLILLSSLLINSQIFAGLLLEQESYLENNPEKKGKGLIYISDNKLKFVAGNSDPVVIFNLNNNKLIKIDNKSKEYSESTPQKYVEFVRKHWIAEKKGIKKQLANLPKEKRAQQINLLRHNGIDIYRDEEPKNWTFNKTDETKTVAGLKSNKIELFEDGKLIEELWVSNSIEEIDFKKFAKFYGEIQKISQGLYLDLNNQDTFSKMFTEVYKLGYPLESIDYKLPGNRIEKILTIKQVELSDKDFRPPSDYKKIEF